MFIRFGPPGIIGGHCFAPPLALAEDFFHVLWGNDEGRGSSVTSDRDRLALRGIDQLAKAVLRFD
jgi:hypothetical protein